MVERTPAVSSLARALALALAFVVLLPTIPVGEAQLPATPLDPILKGVQENKTALKQTLVGPDLDREDVDVTLDMDFRDVDFDTMNVIFGGGKFSANMRITGRIDLRVLAASRVQDAIESAAPGTGNVTGIAFAETRFIPADAFRASLTAEALAAFENEQEARLAEFITESIPNVTVMATRFAWSNVSPQDSFQDATLIPTGIPPETRANELNDPTFPPITLVATIDMEYLERTNLLQILEKALEPESAREKARKEQVADQAADYERSAFSLLGIRQVLDLEAFSGWNIAVKLHLPEGYTFEEASPDVALARNLREAQVVTLGKDATLPVLNPVSLTLSNRFLVSTAMLGAILLCGVILRFPILLAVNLWRRKTRV